MSVSGWPPPRQFSLLAGTEASSLRGPVLRLYYGGGVCCRRMRASRGGGSFVGMASTRGRRPVGPFSIQSSTTRAGVRRGVTAGPSDAAPVASAWVVLKFGGTSVASLTRWEVIARRAEELLSQGLRVWIVVSAVTQVTNALERAIRDALAAPYSETEAPSASYSAEGGGEGSTAVPRVVSSGSLSDQASVESLSSLPERLKEYGWIVRRHEELGAELRLDDDDMSPVRRLLGELRRILEGIHLTKEASPRVRARVTAFGELMSSWVGRAFLQCRLSHGQDRVVRRVDARSLLVAGGGDAHEDGHDDDDDEEVEGATTAGSVREPAASQATWEGESHEDRPGQYPSDMPPGMIFAGTRGAPTQGAQVVSEEDKYLNADVAPGIAPHACEMAARGADVVITQGFIAVTRDGDTCLLGRGGSDTSGGLFACMLQAVRCEIWTDVHGMFTADPRKSPDARLLRRLSYREAQELAAMGAKVLHPRCLVPAAHAGVPVEIRNTEDPDCPAEAVTRIEAEGASQHPEILAVARRGNIAMVTVSTLGMWGAVGFVASVFDTCARLGFSVDLIATSQYAVSLTFDHVPGGVDGSEFRRLLSLLRKNAKVEALYPCSVVSVVGRQLRRALHALGPALAELEKVECHMVSEAAEDLNFSFVVAESQGEALLARLHSRLLGDEFLLHAGHHGSGPEDISKVRADLFGPSWTRLRERTSSLTSVGLVATTAKEPFPRGIPAAAPILATESAWFLHHREREALAGLVRSGAVSELYCYHLPTIRARAERLCSAFLSGLRGRSGRVMYALKANDHSEVVRTLLASGVRGLECVSLGEVRFALEQSPALVQYTPNFAPQEEIAEVAQESLRRAGGDTQVEIVLDSPEMVEALGEELDARGVDATGLVVGLRVDLRPADLWEGEGGAAPTHHVNVTTVGPGQKFGCPLRELARAVAAVRARGWSMSGLHSHAGSGILDQVSTWARVALALCRAAVSSGAADTLRWLDVGGGLGVVERPGQTPLDVEGAFEALGAAGEEVAASCPRLEELRLEPGRYCVAPAGVLLGRVTLVRSKVSDVGEASARFVGLSTGMHSLVRPAMYGSRHEAFWLGHPALSALDAIDETTDETIAAALGASPADPVSTHVVGPICESGDVLCRDARFVAGAGRGDVIAIANGGAYGSVMSSRYNRRGSAPEFVMDETSEGELVLRQVGC
jgi:bifunctional diaminopimelate decarboxylase / aspartate kinase